MHKLLAAAAYLGSFVASPFTGAQSKLDPRNLPAGENVTGKVTAVANDSVSVAPNSGGVPVTVHVSDSTRILKGRQPAKLGEVKVDDEVLARGALHGDAMDAAILVVMSPEMLQLMQQLGPAAGTGAPGSNREDLGKKFIAGQVKAISGTKLTILRSDKQNQQIEVDENTSFKKGNESITLTDIKVDDYVFGSGAIKDGTFVPRQLNVGPTASTNISEDHSKADAATQAPTRK